MRRTSTVQAEGWSSRLKVQLFWPSASRCSRAGIVEAQLRDLDALAQQRQQLDGKRQLVDAGHLGRHAARIAEVDRAPQVRQRQPVALPLPGQRHRAADLELAFQRGADFLVEPRTRAVPVGVVERDGGSGRDGQGDGNGDRVRRDWSMVEMKMDSCIILHTCDVCVTVLMLFSGRHITMAPQPS
jgi:hypothetical protein